MPKRLLTGTAARIVGALTVLAGLVGLILAPLVGEALFNTLWGIEPLSYIGAILVMAGLVVATLSYALAGTLAGQRLPNGTDESTVTHWSQVTQHYFEMFDHDLGRPLRRILGKEREVRAVLQFSEAGAAPAVRELLDEVERQAPNFRLMMSNIQALVHLEAPTALAKPEAIEATEVVRWVVDRYTPVAAESHKELTWWSEPTEFGIVYSDSSAIEHIVTNLVDNAIRFATSHVEIKITRNPSHLFVRVWDDGPGIAPQYVQHIFDRGWTPEVARREEKSNSGLGLFIARTLARRFAGDLTVGTIASPDASHHTAFLLSLPLGEPG